jgi:hypothetical protein
MDAFFIPFLLPDLPLWTCSQRIVDLHCSLLLVSRQALLLVYSVP